MIEWADTYRRAVADVRLLAGIRRILSPELSLLLDDLDADALVIAREADNRLRRRRLRAFDEALPLFDKDNAP